MPTILLADNGSRRAGATLQLRKLAAQLSENSGMTVHPVSLQHADKIDPASLNDIPAQTFEPFIRSCLEKGERDFIVVPLFFGPSRALSRFIPDHVETLQQEFGEFDLRIADVLYPLPQGEPGLTKILYDNILNTEKQAKIKADQVILVDHGSPIPEVTAVREHLARELQVLLGSGVNLGQAVMERREGSEYDFNGALLEEVLRESAQQQPKLNVILSMLFLLPGRHAGAGGDIDEIYGAVEKDFPGLKVTATGLVGDQPEIIEILQSRLEACLKG